MKNMFKREPPQPIQNFNRQDSSDIFIDQDAITSVFDDITKTKQLEKVIHRHSLYKGKQILNHFIQKNF